MTLNAQGITGGAKCGINQFGQNNQSSLYAKKGEPTYLKEMDLDEDGSVTFDEFRQYCKDKGLSSYEIKQMLEARMLWKMLQAMQEKKEEVEEEKQEKEKIYATSADENYDIEMDTNKDNKITYDEYMKYCEAKENEKKSEKNADKVASLYSFKEVEPPKISIQSEA